MNEYNLSERARQIHDEVAMRYSPVFNQIIQLRDKINLFKGGGKTNTSLNKTMFLQELNLALKKHPEFNTPLWRQYFTTIADLETGGTFNKQAKNPKSSAYGYFQLLRANRKTGDLFEDMFNLTKSNKQYMYNNMSKDFLRGLNDKGIDPYTVMAGLHFRGPGIISYLSKGIDSNLGGTTASDYLHKYLTRAKYAHPYTASIITGEDKTKRGEFTGFTDPNTELAQEMPQKGSSPLRTLFWVPDITKIENDATQSSGLGNYPNELQDAVVIADKPGKGIITKDLLDKALAYEPELIEEDSLFKIPDIRELATNILKSYANDLSRLLESSLLENEYNLRNSQFKYFFNTDNKRKEELDLAELLQFQNNMANISALGGRLFAEGGKDHEGLVPSHFTLWTADSAIYNPNYDSLFEGVNWRALNNNLLFSTPGLAANITSSNANPGYINLIGDANKVLLASDNNCLGSTLNFNSNKMPMFGVQPLRNIIKDFWIPGYKGGAYNMLWRPGMQADYEEGTSPNSWNMAVALSDAGYGRIINVADDPEFNYANYPIGTIFNVGNAAPNYIGFEEYTKPDGTKGLRAPKDVNGNFYPRHSYMIAGFNKTGDKNVPLFYDYGNIGYGLPDMYPDELPTYAFIPYGYEHLTADNVMPRYTQWLKDMLNNRQTLKSVALKDQPEALKLIDAVNLKELQELNNLYGTTNDNSINILRRLMAIGALESELGYTLTGDDYGGLSGMWNELKYKTKEANPLLVSLTKDITRLPHSPEFSLYDTKTAYEHEMDIYNRLEKQGAFKGRTEEYIRQRIADEFNKEKRLAGFITYGEVDPGYSIEENHNNSRGIFQMKASKPFTVINADGTKTVENIDDRYQGDSDILKAYNRMLFNMQMIKNKYPDLTDELLLDAATIGWNAMGKVGNKDFIDFYIRNSKLPDSYLEKIRKHQTNLYGSYALGGVINPNNPILNFANNPHAQIPATYAAYGGNITTSNLSLNNIKEGDTLDLTNEQIEQLIKKGYKLRYI